MMIRDTRSLVLSGLGLLLSAGIGVAQTASEDAPLATVASVDLARYAGTWHEVARMPNRFQKKCARATTATYALRDDGRISVTNSCVTNNGKVDEATGVARVVDTDSNAKLQVSFVSLFGWQLFWGDYWVIGLDDDYQWVVVGHPGRKYGWILSRTPTLGASSLERAYSILERGGYSRDDFEMSRP
jgi:apolipoprotein D and lipocalin family protein